MSFYYLDRTPRSKKKRVLKKFRKLKLAAQLEYDLFLLKIPETMKEFFGDSAFKETLVKELFSDNFLLKNIPKDDSWAGGNMITIPFKI